MDTEIYREFMTLVTHRNFVSAARDLNMSQSSLSRHMAALSHELGCQLFYETRPLTLTAAGEVVLRWSGKIVGDQASMKAELKSLPPSNDTRITVADLLSLNMLYIGLTDAINRAKAAFPGFRADYLEMQNSGLNPSEMVEKGRVDISFEVIAGDKPTTSLERTDGLQAIWVPEFHGRLVCGVGKESPLASKQSRPLSDFSQSRFILQANRYSERFRKDFIEMCSEVGFYPNITLVPSDNPLEFYSTPPKDGVHLLSRVDRSYRPLISEGLKRNAAIVTLEDKDRFVDAFIIAKAHPEQPELAFILECLKAHAESERERLEL